MSPPSPHTSRVGMVVTGPYSLDSLREGVLCSHGIAIKLDLRKVSNGEE
jgi:hypothetical protein